MRLLPTVVLALFVGAQSKPAGSAKVPAALNFTVNSINGKAVDLARYQGQVVLMVNVASQCGYTPQYAGLEELHKKYSAKGLRILGFPSNDFGEQEPGNDSEIAQFCKQNYGVGFDMFSKIVVKGFGREVGVGATPSFQQGSSSRGFSPAECCNERKVVRSNLRQACPDKFGLPHV